MASLTKPRRILRLDLSRTNSLLFFESEQVGYQSSDLARVLYIRMLFENLDAAFVWVTL